MDCRKHNKEPSRSTESRSSNSTTATLPSSSTIELQSDNPSIDTTNVAHSTAETSPLLTNTPSFVNTSLDNKHTTNNVISPIESIQSKNDHHLNRPNYGTRSVAHAPPTSISSLHPEIPPEEIASLKYKLIALICSLLLAFGSHFAAHTLGTLKGRVKEELNISNSQYGVLQSSVAIVNTILPMLAGLFIDKFGTQIGSVLATSLAALGYTLAATATSLASFPLMIIGYVLYGLGSGSITVVQGTILSHWFRGKGLAIVMGLEVATSRLASYLSMATVVSIAQWTGFYGWAFWFAALLCVLSWIVNLIYVLFMRYLHEEQGMERQELARKKAFHPRNLLYFPSTFWFIIGMIFTLGSCWTIFLHFNTEMVKLRFGHNDQTSAYIASIAQVLPIFFAPFQGYLHDYYGYRAFTASMSTLTFITSMLFFLWWPHLSPIIGMVVFSVSLTIGPVAIFSSVPLVLASSVVGTGLGVYKSTLNIGVSLLDIVAGMLQDYASHHDIPGQTRDEYSLVLAFCAIIGGIGFLFSLGVWWTDPHGVLQCGRRNRTEPLYIPSNPLNQQVLETDKKHANDTDMDNDESTTTPLLPTSTTGSAISLPPVKWYSWMAVGLLTTVLLASWLLFVLKLVHPKQ